MAMGLAFVGGLRDSEFKRWLHDQVYTVSFQILGGALSVVITYHNPSNRPPKQGICVANHTSPIDVLVLACDNAYALVRNTRLIMHVEQGFFFSSSRLLSRLGKNTLGFWAACKVFCLGQRLIYGLIDLNPKTEL